MVHRFLRFELDTDLYELRRDGEPIAVRPRVFDLLTYLVVHRERVVSKDELLDALWPGATVSEESLTRAVSSVRSALRTSEGAPPIIQTVPTRGYRFVAALELAPPDSTAGARFDELFVGREQEMQRLESLLDRALAGSGALALVFGEPGIGKSRSVEVLAERARRRGARVFVGGCPEERDAPAFWPWVQILDRVRREMGTGRMREMLGGDAPRVARLLPEIGDPHSDAPSEAMLGPESVRVRLFEGLCRFFQTLGRERPLMLVLEDIHRADAASLLALRFLADGLAGLAGLPALAVATFRDTEVHEGEESQDLIAQLVRRGSTVSIPLRGLSREPVARFAAAWGHELDPRGLAELCDQTGGNPFFLRQIVPLIGSGSGEAIDPQGRSSVFGLESAIAEHLKLLEPACRALLRVAAVIGRNFTRRSLVAASGESQVDGHLERAFQARIITRSAEAEGEYRFAHELLRTALYRELTEAERDQLHVSVADHWEGANAAQARKRIAEIAFHRLAALPSGDPQAAARAALLAGDEASGQLAYEEAAKHYASALEVAEAHLVDSESLRCDLLLRLAREHLRIGKRSAAADFSQRAAELARALHSPERMAEAVFNTWPGLYSAEPGPFMAAQILAEASEALGETNPALQARILSRRALDFISVPRPGRVRLAERAVDLATKSGQPGALAAALSARAINDCSATRPGDTLRLAREMVRLAMEDGGQPASLSYRFWVIQGCLEAGAGSEAEAELAIVEHQARSLGQRYEIDLTTLLRRAESLYRGRYDDVETTPDDLWQRCAGDGVMLHGLAVQRLKLLADTGRIDEAIHFLEAGVGSGIEPWPAWQALLLTLRARSSARVASEDAPRQLRRLARDGFAAMAHHFARAGDIVLAADASAALGTSDLAETILRSLTPFENIGTVGGLGFVYLGHAGRPLGDACRSLGRYDEAIEHFDRAIEHESRLGALPSLARAQLACARALSQRKGTSDASRAQALRREALSSADRIGLVLPDTD